MRIDPSENYMIELGPHDDCFVTIDEAMLYIYTLTHNNKYDWRFPTAAEYDDTDEMPPMTWHSTWSDYNNKDLERAVYPVRDKDD
jgi:hypothetical protein